MAFLDPSNTPQDPQIPDQSQPAATSDSTSGQPSSPGVFHSLFQKLSSGTDTQYKVDPTSGQTVATQVPEKPGQLFRNILAAGLMGGAGVGPNSGQHNFAQGLLAGLSGGTKEAVDMSKQQDALKRQQAQQDYTNQLKTQDAQRQQQAADREDKESQARLDLNKVQIAHTNAETAVQSQLLHDHLQNQQGAAANLLVNSSKDVVGDYNSLGIKPREENLTVDQMHQRLKDDPTLISKHVAVPTGVRDFQDPDTKDAQGNVVPGQWHTEETYSIYDPMTKVTPDMLAKAKTAGVDVNSPMYKELAQASANGSDVDFRKVAALQAQISKSFDWQKELLDINQKKSEVARNYAAATASGVEAKLRNNELILSNGQIADQKSFRDGKDLYNKGYDPNALDDKQRQSLSDFMGVVRDKSQDALKEIAQAYKADPTNTDLQKKMNDAVTANSLYQTQLMALDKNNKIATASSSPTSEYTKGLNGVAPQVFSSVVGIPGVKDLASARIALAKVAPGPNFTEADRAATEQSLTKYFEDASSKQKETTNRVDDAKEKNAQEKLGSAAQLGPMI